MTDRENLFRPIHKGIRSLLYELGNGVQRANFADVAETNAITTRLTRDLGNAISDCVLCLLRVHSRHEEKDIFSAVRPHDPDVVDLMMREHGEVARRIHGVSKTCTELRTLKSRSRRIEVGDRLNLEVNDLFAYYLSHLNNEEATMVPVLWERFTDEELRAMRSKFYDSVPLRLFEVWVRWTLPSLNVNELIVLFSGLKKGPGSARFADWTRLARETLEPSRLRTLEDKVDLGPA